MSLEINANEIRIYPYKPIFYVITNRWMAHWNWKLLNGSQGLIHQNFKANLGGEKAQHSLPKGNFKYLGCLRLYGSDSAIDEDEN